MVNSIYLEKTLDIGLIILLTSMMQRLSIIPKSIISELIIISHLWETTS